MLLALPQQPSTAADAWFEIAMGAQTSACRCFLMLWVGTMTDQATVWNPRFGRLGELCSRRCRGIAERRAPQCQNA